MKLALFIIAGLLALAWIGAYFIFNAGMYVHILIILSALSWMQAIIISPRPQPNR